MALTITYTANAQSASDLTTYTFSTQAISTAASNRKVAVITYANAGTAATVSSMTIGGVSATQVIGVQSGNKTGAIWIADVPTGTTADVVVTWSAGRVRCAIIVFAIYGTFSSTAYDTGSDITMVAGAMSDTMNCPAGGVILAGIGDLAGGSHTATAWTNLTERADATHSEGGSFSGASDAFASVQTGLAITATMTGGTEDAPILVLASFEETVPKSLTPFQRPNRSFQRSF